MERAMNLAVELAARAAPKIDPNKGDKNVGSAQNSSNSASQILSTLAPVALVALIYFVLFIVLRKKFPRKYEPRSFLDSLDEHQRSPTLPSGMFAWLGAFMKIPDSYVLNHHSLDAYLFLRFLKLCIVSCLVGCCITWPILFPINITGGNGKKQLDMLTWANVQNRYKLFAHVGCAWLFYGFVMYMIVRESIYYINLRQAYLMSPLYTARMSSRTVLYTSVPDDYLNEVKLREMLGSHVKNIWFPTDTTDLEEMVKNRDKALMKLEAAETKLVKTSNAARLKAAKKGAEPAGNPGAVEGGESGSVASQYISAKQRPTHKLKFLIGKKVDTIDWCRTELQETIPKVAAEQEKHRRGEAKLNSSVFVEFDSVTEAQAAFQSLTHHQVLHMAPRFTGLTPGDIIWKNLNISWAARIIRGIIATTFVVFLVIFWSIPVAAVGAISNISKLSSISGLSWLSFLNGLPAPVTGLINGLLPVILLAVLMALLPIILRKMARIAGRPSISWVELTVQNYYFAFQVVQVFLVATLSSAAAGSIQQILKNPKQVTSLLSTSIPTASNFYLSYFILQGLGVVSTMLVGLVGLILFYVLGRILDTTPRKMYKRWSSLTNIGWGTLYPIYTNLFVIALCYAIVAPLVVGFAAIGLYFFYFAFRYNFLFVVNASIDCKGRGFPLALQHLFVGLYISQVCIIGLIGTSLSTVAALGPLLLMLLLLIFTILFHMNLNAALEPLIEYMPKSIAAEERRLLEAEGGEHGKTDASAGDFADADVKEARMNGVTAHDATAPHPKPGMFKKFFRPDIYCDYQTMRRLVPRELATSLVHERYNEQVERDAYFNPAITSGVPLLWIPRDEMGVSRQEVRDSGKVVPITDVGAHLDEKNKIVWDEENKRPPIYEEPVYY